MTATLSALERQAVEQTADRLMERQGFIAFAGKQKLFSAMTAESFQALWEEAEELRRDRQGSILT